MSENKPDIAAVLLDCRTCIESAVNLLTLAAPIQVANVQAVVVGFHPATGAVQVAGNAPPEYVVMILEAAIAAVKKAMVPQPPKLVLPDGPIDPKRFRLN